MSALYTPEMLALSTELARYPWSDQFAHQAEARSPVCGSAITLGLDLDGDGAVARVGLKLSACAVGQSSAAILLGGMDGANRADIASALESLRRWTRGEGDLPEWPRISAIAGARPHPGRHGALLLPWEAAARALS